MKIFGIVIEANPLHTGHLYFIKQIKEQYSPDLIIAITSTSFTMRGEISLIDKFTKTSLYLESGIDIVMELPFYKAVQSADYFAKNACLTLANMGITNLVFGSETTNDSLFTKYLEFLKNNSLNNKTTSKKQQLIALLDNSPFNEDEKKIVAKPNFTLGSIYIKTIKDNDLNIKWNTIKRIGNNYHDKILTSNIASATTIREYLKKKKDVTNFIPYSTTKLIDINKAEEALNLLTKYHFSLNDKITCDYGKKEGIPLYIKNNGDFSNDYQTLINSLKNKKYTVSLINRCILHSLLNVGKHNQDTTYLRLLGANKKGFEYISILPKNTKKQLFSNPNELLNQDIDQNVIDILNIELKATKLYQTITNSFDLYKNEFKLPIRKDD